MSSYSADTLDLSRLAAPSLVPASYDEREASFWASFLVEWAKARAIDPTLPQYNVQTVKADPVATISRPFAYELTGVRRSQNDHANALRLVTATGADLDHVATTYHRTQRRLLKAADPIANTPAIYESDDEYRARALIAPEATSKYGLTPGGYIFKIRDAFADRIKSVRTINRGAGRVEIRLLGRDGDGTVPPALLSEVASAFAGEDGSQSTDIVTFLSAEVEHCTPKVTLAIRRGPDPEVVKVAARRGLEGLAVELHALNAPRYREAISSAAHVAPVITVRVDEPFEDRPARPEVAHFLTGFDVQTEYLA